MIRKISLIQLCILLSIPTSLVMIYFGFGRTSPRSIDPSLSRSIASRLAVLDKNSVNEGPISISYFDVDFQNFLNEEERVDRDGYILDIQGNHFVRDGDLIISFGQDGLAGNDDDIRSEIWQHE